MQAGDERLNWWQTRWFVAVMAFVAAIPLLLPDVPPLVDLPGHLGRWRVQQSIGQAPWLADWYNFEWQLIGNLGIDLLVVPLEPLLGLERAVKLIVIAIPVLTAVGLLWIAREVHGRIPATALFALPIVYSFPFHFGFVNFALAMALALNAFALWLRLARLGHIRLRAILFVPLGLVLWVTHTYGWGLLGVLAFSGELIRQHDRGRNWFIAAFVAGLHCIVLLPPAILMLVWRSGGDVTGQTADWFNWRIKARWVLMIFRDRWELLDMATLAACFLLLLKGVRDPAIEYSRNLSLSALFLLAVYLLLPRIVFGSAYADMRLAPFLLGIALLALRPKAGLSIRGASVVAAIGMVFFVGRVAATTVSFWQYDQSYDRQLAALDKLPVGARLLTFIGETCRDEWTMSRLEHLPAMALTRKLAFSNDQWSMAGAQMLTVKYEAGRGFNHDPAQIVTDVKCPRQYWRPIAVALTRFPRNAFDYVWMVDPPAYDRRLEAGLTPLWRDGNSALFRVEDRRPPRLLMQDLGPYGPEYFEAISRRRAFGKASSRPGTPVPAPPPRARAPGSRPPRA
ncbi:hypothetical protein [Sphingomonas qomolangmaensis]|uniref:Glycosyltransferase RgtA/B/C/D-like domain-containing protein n=1 Tax=Sphingomonas qomolangmaensis TaxID=2918765 RepID=A0ABY5L6L8_9SPHN|nr:hypothetical protein [Sphingomonas qomolangmaensis]UUL81801.1 hypothetical protein NMP03_11400 [Sphingomonas qomolangmaensis]